MSDESTKAIADVEEQAPGGDGPRVAAELERMREERDAAPGQGKGDAGSGILSGAHGTAVGPAGFLGDAPSDPPGVTRVPGYRRVYDCPVHGEVTDVEHVGRSVFCSLCLEDFLARSSVHAIEPVVRLGDDPPLEGLEPQEPAPAGPAAVEE